MVVHCAKHKNYNPDKPPHNRCKYCWEIYKEKHGTSVIPRGPYCENCPYWDRLPDRENQFNGWCWYMQEGDLEIEQEMELTCQKTGKVLKGNEMPFPVSLLWDGCKECGENDDDSDYIMIGENE